jgi:hypothetical protein
VSGRMPAMPDYPQMIVAVNHIEPAPVVVR